MLKKIITIAAFVAIAAGCAKVAVISAPANIEEETEKIPEVTVEPSSVVFTAGIDTKAYLDGEGAVMWRKNDAITIWNGKAAAEFTTTGSGASATFSTAGGFLETGTYTALYPHDAGANFSDLNALATTLPASQVATAGSFDPAANLAVASSTTTDLTFYNLVSYLKFTVPTGMKDLTSVSFSGNNSEKVAGAATVNVSTKALSATGSDTATLTGPFAEGSTYYLAIAPREFTAGYTVTITRSSGTYTMVSSKDVTFTRSKARNIGDLWDGSYEVSGSALAAPAKATLTVGPRTNSNTSLKEYTYSYKGDLAAGDVSIKKAYSSTPAGSAAITTPGWYHLFYNETKGTFKLYDQEVSVNFGSTIDGMNNISSNDKDSSATLYDYNNDKASTITVTVGEGFTGVYSNSSFTNNPIWEFWLDDYDFKPAMFYSNIEIKKEKGTGDTSPATITVSGLNSSRKYDFRISGGRGGGSLAARQTKITIGGVDKTYNQGLGGTGSDSATNATSVDFRTNNIALFEGLSPNASSEITISVVGIDTGSACEAHVGCIFISRVAE